MIYDWIESNPYGHGSGWEPYTISLRIVNWIKWLTKNSINDPKINQSLMMQANFLSNRIEYDIQGNHLIANYKALYFCGLFFAEKDSERFFNIGTKGITKEFKKQILEDGMHFEFSPMYQMIVLEDLLDIISISMAYENNTKMIF